MHLLTVTEVLHCYYGNGFNDSRLAWPPYNFSNKMSAQNSVSALVRKIQFCTRKYVSKVSILRTLVGKTS